jgi:hypothetical protein
MNFRNGFIILLCIAATIARASDKTKVQSPNFSSNIIDNIFMSEISGAVKINGDLWVINDGGNRNSIYRINERGKVLQEIKISNATNIDWEELTCSTTDLYIGDFGNNNGNRKNLRIYKISLENINHETTELEAALVNFKYEDQRDFSQSTNSSDFDCEAMCFYNESLHLFTKNWRSGGSNHYILNAEEGFHEAVYSDHLNTDFLVTAAALENNCIYFSGYNISDFSVKIMTTFIDDTASATYTTGTLLSFGQVESIVIENGCGILLSESISRGYINIPGTITFFDSAAFVR